MHSCHANTAYPYHHWYCKRSHHIEVRERGPGSLPVRRWSTPPSAESFRASLLVIGQENRWPDGAAKPRQPSGCFSSTYGTVTAIRKLEQYRGCAVSSSNRPRASKRTRWEGKQNLTRRCAPPGARSRSDLAVPGPSSQRHMPSDESMPPPCDKSSTRIPQDQATSPAPESGGPTGLTAHSPTPEDKRPQA